MISDLEFLRQCNNQKPTDPPPEFISDYIDGRRILPPGSPRPGIFDIHVMPAMIEPMNNMGPYSGVNRTTMMKGVQIAATTYLSENVIAYYMDANPAEILYCTATNALLEKWTKRLEPLIDSCGFRDKISAQANEGNKKSRKTGDKMYSKEYPGGSLSMASLQAPASLRSESNQIIITDELDGTIKKETSTGEGGFLGLLDGRAAAYGENFKLMELSTPKLLEDSVIYPQFEDGDQRYYNVPCLRCGADIVFKSEQLRPVYDKLGRLENVWYECECNGQLFDSDKKEMMLIENAKWVPTAVPKDRRHRSYQLSSLYSPFASWTKFYTRYLKAEEDPLWKPTFVNLWQGLPYKEEGQRPTFKANEKRGDYKNGTVPEGVLYMTLAADVQRGAERYQAMTEDELTAEIEKLKSAGKNLWKSELPRIELEIYGVGSAYRSWSIDYRVFYGHTTRSPYEGAFERLYDWIEDKKHHYPRKDGLIFAPKIACMDASDGVTAAAVFEFCSRVEGNFYPNVNDGWLKKKKDPGIDEETRFNYDRYRLAKKGKGGPEYIQISTNHYKRIVYQRLNIPREKDPTKPSRPGFCDFPRDRDDFYFSMLKAEELLSDGSFRSGGRRNESLDVRGYNLAIADVWLESEARRMQAEAEKKGTKENDLSKIKKWILRQMELRLVMKKVA
jgi:phage terminase large subunit GpA-like protein